MKPRIEQWRKAVLPVDVIIKQAVEVLDKVALKIVLIVDDVNNLVGTVTDGDIRRGLLGGLNLNSPVIEVTNKNPLVLNRKITQEEILNLMHVHKVQQIPILNSENKLIGLYLWDEMNASNKISNTIVIMAGGQGLRLRPETLNCPKPLLRVAGKPILEHIILRAKAQGFSNFIIAINYLGHMIEDYFQNGDNFGVKIEYLREPYPLGTAGALSLLDPNLNSPFILINGDVITTLNFSDFLHFHNQNDAFVSMAIKEYESQNPYGVIKTQGLDVVDIYEKPLTRTNINAGMYVITTSILSELNKLVYLDMPDLLRTLQKKGKRIIAFPIYESWADIGTLKDIRKLN
jgi:dTDP-glucose pyrophosphorylase